MSAELFGEDVVFYQRLLKACGFYNDKIDGIWGSNTDKADRDFLETSRRIKDSHGEFDPRSERHIARLHVEAQKLARIFLKEAKTGPNRCTIISGTRSYEEQNKLFRKGRWGNRGPKVTNARGGQSNHNFCIAWDVGLFDSTGKYLTGSTKAEVKAYDDLASIVDLSKLDWGGDWKSFKDRPHYQVSTGKKTSEVRALFERGEPYL